MSTTINSAPIQDNVIDESRKATKTWIFFFNALSDGDNGTDWTPVSSGITGTNTYTGKYFKNSGFIDFWITVDPTTTSSATFGSSYFELPFDVTVASSCSVVYGSTVAQGIVDPSTNRCFPASWSTSAVVTITGRVFTK